MPTWNSEQYLKFANERTQPSIDLASRIAIRTVRRIVDLGCGPGNSTAVVARRWPSAEITGVDSSEAMLDTARMEHPEWTWIQADIAEWPRTGERFDLVFSNAALHWLPNHGVLLPRLFSIVAEGGVFAFQIPHSITLAHQVRIRELAASPAWRGRFTHPPRSWHVEPPDFYYDALAPLASRVDVWLTDYAHVMPGPEAIVEWHRGTGLRPFLDALPNEEARSEFLAQYLAALEADYTRRSDGRILMYFRRLFVIAYR